MFKFGFTDPTTAAKIKERHHGTGEYDHTGHRYSAHDQCHIIFCLLVSAYLLSKLPAITNLSQKATNRILTVLITTYSINISLLVLYIVWYVTTHRYELARLHSQKYGH